MNTAVPSKAGMREWMGLAVLALACILYTMDLTVLHLAVPNISADLQPTSVQLLWIIDIYGFFVAGSLITLGNLGDRIGRRRLLLIGAITFALTSVLAAFSTSAEMLIVSRALLGVSGATIAPSTLSLIRNMFHDPNQRTAAIGVWISSFSAGAAIGPLVGGVLIQYFWWGSVFLLAVPVMGALLMLGPKLLPEFKDPQARRLDIFSAVLSLASILVVIYGIKQIAQDGWQLQSIMFVGAGAVFGIVFLQRQRKLVYPLIDLQLFRLPTFNTALVTLLLGVFIAFGVFLFLSQYLQLVIGLSPLEAGIWMLPWSLAFVVGSTLTPRIVRRIPPISIIAGGLAVAAVGFGLLIQIDASTSLLFLATGLVISSLGLAPVFTLTTDLVVGSAPPERAGAASAISETTGELGGALGIAVMGSIGTTIYRTELTRNIPVGIPSEAQETALESLGGAVSLVGQLPGGLGSMLLDIALGSFIQGLQFTLIISAAVAAVAAALVFVTLRNVQMGSEQN
ncbi:MAG TPA: MFS transporter [Nitrososphaeraceae archaeon]|nr:MFS transporter [Nitrososphaeraceae archaeon]